MKSAAQHFHFMGICGTAMGAVAAALQEKGCKVTGSDENVYPPMSTFLESRSIRLFNGYSADNLPSDPNAIVVVGNAIRRGNPEAEEALNRKLYYTSLPEVLKEHFLRGKHNLVVTGTHGKTTTTTLLTWIFETAGHSPSFLIGGIPKNLGQGAKLSDSRYFILEGDEYDTAFFDKRSKFVHYLPELVIVNNIEFDHADIYKNLDEIKLSFRRLLNIVPGNGLVLINADDPNAVDVAKTCPAPILEVGFSENAANRISKVRYAGGNSHFHLFDREFVLPMIGEFNVRNAAMAISAAHFYQVPLDVIQKALSTFEGVSRRQEVRGEVNGITIVDDFGHHPTAIRETLQAMRHRFQGRKLWALFEPRSNTTRRAVFQTELPDALKLADAVVISQVAKLEQIPEEERLNPARVVDDIRAAKRDAFYEPNVEAIVATLKTHAKSGDVVVVFSNGGFGGIHEKLLAALA